MSETPIRCLVVLLAGIEPLSGAHAETLALTPAPPPSLESVVVTSSRAPTPLSETPVTIAQISAADIEARRATFTGEVLNTIPGVHMTDLGNEQHSMAIRQPLTTNPLYLYMEDGIPIRPLGLFNHNSLYEINLDGAGGIEVIKGPASSLYGSNSVGGTINFLTQAPSRDPVTRVAAQASDQGYWRNDVNLSGTSGPVGARLSGYVSRRNGGWQDYNDGRKESLTGRVDWQLSDATRLKGLLTYNHLYSDMPGSLFADDFRDHPGRSYNHFTYRDVYATRGSLVLSGDWLEAGETTLTLYARNNSTEQLPSYNIVNVLDSHGDPTADASGRRNDNDFSSLGFDARQQLNFDWLQSRLIAGATLESTDNDYTEDNLAIDRNVATSEYTDYRVAGLRRDYGVNLANAATYSQYEFTPLAKTRVVLGARYDAIRYDYGNHLAPGKSTGAPSETRTFNHLSPKIGAIWSPTPRHSVFVNHAQGFTPPEVSALYSSINVPNLKESVFTNDEIGWRGAFFDDDLRLDLTAYRLDGRDEVINFSMVDRPSEARNAGKTLHQGLEFGLNWRAGEQWRLALAVSRSHHEYREYQVSDQLDYSGKDMPAAPEWMGNTEIRWTPSALRDFSAALEWQYLGRYWMDNANTVRYGGYNLFNLRLAYTLPSTGASSWNLWLKGINLADRHYAETASSSYTGVGPYTPNTMDSYSPGNPRSVMLGVEYRYGE